MDMRKAWDRAIEKAGIEKQKGLSLYSLRHSFAVHFLEGGAAVTDLQGQLGHADLATTQHYARMVDERRRDSVLALRFKKGTSTASGKGVAGEIGASGGATGPTGSSGKVEEHAA